MRQFQIETPVGRPLGYVPSPPDSRDYILEVSKRLYIPSSIDYSSEMTPVEDQGSEGSCVGFACDSFKEWQEKKDWERVINLSPRFVYEEARKIDGLPNCFDGTNLRAAMKVLNKKGLCREETCPYIPNHPVTITQKMYKEALMYRIKEYWNIRREDIKGALVQNGPIVAGVSVYQNWFADSVEETGIIPLPSGKLLGGHAICLAGYDDDHIKFKNSWSTDWGAQGYGYLPWEYEISEAWVTVDNIVDEPPESTAESILERIRLVISLPTTKSSGFIPECK